jgi:hypothetical protein
MSSLDLSKNGLGGFYVGYRDDGSGYGSFTATPEGPNAIADAIPDMRALTKFDISSSDIRAKGGKALAAVLKGNQVITELNICDNKLGYNSAGNGDTSGVIAIADAIPDMRALIKLDISTNYIGAKQQRDLQRICVAGGIELTADADNEKQGKKEKTEKKKKKKAKKDKKGTAEKKTKKNKKKA